MYSYGKLIGTRTVYNDRLLMFMLRNRAPERFTGGKPNALNAVDKMQLTRLKKQWHKEWEDERAREEAADPEATTDALDAMIDGMQRNWLDGLTRSTRALYIAYTAAADADEAAGRTAWNEPDNAALTGRAGDEPGAEAGDEPGDEWDGANIIRRIELSDFSQSKEQDQ